MDGTLFISGVFWIYSLFLVCLATSHRCALAVQGLEILCVY